MDSPAPTARFCRRRPSIYLVESLSGPATTNAPQLESEDVLALFESKFVMGILEADPDLRPKTIKRLQRVIDRLQRQNK